MSKFDPSDHPIEVQAYAVDANAPAYAASAQLPPGAPPQLGGGGAYCDSERAKAYLDAKGWPLGLQELFCSNANRVAQRYYLLDDSGSMASTDGHLPEAGPRSPPCSRWSELSETMRFHMEAVVAGDLNTQIRFLNATHSNEPLRLGGGQDPNGVNKATIDAIFDEGPSGMTPLCEHMRAIVADITKNASELRRTRQRAVIVIATDGESSDGNLVQAMKPLERLPVWVTVKLCTDDDRIVNFYNELDNQLEVEMDVLDDFRSEAAEVAEAGNNWFTYGLHLHRMREMGLVSKEFDLLDEQKLTHDQMSVIVRIVSSPLNLSARMSAFSDTTRLTITHTHTHHPLNQ